MALVSVKFLRQNKKKVILERRNMHNNLNVKYTFNFLVIIQFIYAMDKIFNETLSTINDTNKRKIIIKTKRENQYCSL